MGNLAGAFSGATPVKFTAVFNLSALHALV